MHRYRRGWGRHGPLVSGMIILFLVAPVLPAQQLTVFDGLVVTPVEAGGRAHSFAPPRPGLPASLVEPIDYFSGTAFFTMEVLAKPSDRRGVLWQVAWKHRIKGLAEEDLGTATGIGQILQGGFDPLYMITPDRGYGTPKGQEREIFAQGFSGIGYYTVRSTEEIDDWKAFNLPLLCHLTMTLVVEGDRYDPGWRCFHDLTWQDITESWAIAQALREAEPGKAYAIATKVAADDDADAAAQQEARRVIASLDAYAAGRLAMWEAVLAHEPDVALAKLAGTVREFSGCAKAEELAESGRRWAGLPVVAAERQARRVYRQLDDASLRLRGRREDPALRARATALIHQLTTTWPGTASARRAVVHARELGIDPCLVPYTEDLADRLRRHVAGGGSLLLDRRVVCGLDECYQFRLRRPEEEGDVELRHWSAVSPRELRDLSAEAIADQAPLVAFCALRAGDRQAARTALAALPEQEAEPLRGAFGQD